jgi:hypothetical protein
MDEWVRAHVQQHVALLRKELSAVEQRIWSHIKGHAELKTVWRRLQTIRGSGPIAAAYLLAEVGHIKRFADPRALVSLAGLAIKRCDSGRTVHARPMIDRHGRTKQADESRAVKRQIAQIAPLQIIPSELSTWHNLVDMSVPTKRVAGAGLLSRNQERRWDYHWNTGSFDRATR